MCNTPTDQTSIVMHPPPPRILAQVSRTFIAYIILEAVETYLPIEIEV